MLAMQHCSYVSIYSHQAVCSPCYKLLLLHTGLERLMQLVLRLQIALDA